MKRVALLALAAVAAGVAWYQAGSPPQPLAKFFPSGALLYLEAKDFSRLLTDWNASTVKSDWLTSANYDEFQRSNLFLKLNGVYKSYGAAAGFAPDMTSLLFLAGDQSALALYDLPHVDFAYITHLPEAKVAQTRLWLRRKSFETRQASGVTFYVNRSPDSTVAFASANGYLLVTTDAERMAGMLGLLTGKNTSNIAEEGWYKQPAEAAPVPGDLRLVMNLESLVESSHFRSYWVQRNTSEVRHFLSGVADIHRTPAEIREDRIFLKRPGVPEDLPPADTIAAAASLAPLAPDDAGLYRIWAKPPAADVAALLESHILDPHATGDIEVRYAPPEEQSASAGSEADLETRIDEPPLPSPTNQPALSTQILAQTDILAMLQVQSSRARPGATFLSLPCAIALVNRTPWNTQAILDALGHNRGITFAAQGPLLVIANDNDLLQTILARPRTPMPAFTASYAAAFRHARERANYQRLMNALDFGPAQPGQSPGFFSANIASLSTALRPINGIQLTERTTPDRLQQTIVYALR
jgi:hypothetical protein